MATDTSNPMTNTPPRLGRKGEEMRVDPKTLRPLTRLVPFVMRYRWRVILTIAFLLIAALTSLLIPLFAGNLIDKGFVAQNLDMVSQYGWAIVAIAAVMAIASGARFYFVSVLGERVLTRSAPGSVRSPADAGRDLFRHCTASAN